MAKITIKFESETVLPNGAHELVYEVPEIYAPDFAGAVAAHPVYGVVLETVRAPTGAFDSMGVPVLGDATTSRPATFREGLKRWADINIRDVILSGVNEFRTRKAQPPPVKVEPIKL